MADLPGYPDCVFEVPLPRGKRLIPSKGCSDKACALSQSWSIVKCNKANCPFRSEK